VQDTYLILDLRNNKYAPGLLTIEGKEVDWYARSIFQVVKDWEANIRDSASVVPLSFFRSSYDPNWSPIEIDPGADHALAESGGEIIWSLFDEPKDRLKNLLPKTLGPLLRSTFKEYGNVSNRWMLLDDAESRDVLENRFGKFIRQESIRLSILGKWEALGGFALAFSGPDVQLPSEGKTWLWEVEDSTKRYTWSNGKFTDEEVATTQSTTGDYDSRWKSLEELERVGAALFVLFWQERLTETVDQRIDDLEGQLEKDRRLLERLRGAYERLSAENRILSGQVA
jgi:hypothetical protein